MKSVNVSERIPLALPECAWLGAIYLG
jgi:hypothetical protein